MADPFRKEYRELSDAEKNALTVLKESAGSLYVLIDSMTESREKSIAKTKLEEAVMWAVKGLTA